MSKDRPKYIAVIGIDGSGKSSCYEEVLSWLSKEYRTAGIGDLVLLGGRGSSLQEPKGIAGLEFKRALSRLSKNTKNFKLYKAAKLPELMMREKMFHTISKKYRVKFIVTDGSPLVNLLGWASHYRGEYLNRDEYIRIIRYLTGEAAIPKDKIKYYFKKIPELIFLKALIKFQKPDIAFFLDVNPKIALERIQKRDKQAQIHENVKFLRRLNDSYKLVLGILDAEFGVQVVKLNPNKMSVSDIASSIINWVEKYETT